MTLVTVLLVLGALWALGAVLIVGLCLTAARRRPTDVCAPAGRPTTSEDETIVSARIRDTWDVTTTREDAGLTLTLRLTAYDSGLIVLDGVPINDSRKGDGYDSMHGWVGSLMTIGQAIKAFRQEVNRRHAAQRSAT